MSERVLFWTLLTLLSLAFSAGLTGIIKGLAPSAPEEKTATQTVVPATPEPRAVATEYLLIVQDGKLRVFDDKTSQVLTLDLRPLVEKTAP